MNMKPLSTIYVAIADDHTLLVDLLAQFINNGDDMEVLITAANGRELLEKIDSALFQPDVCLLDIVMPVMDGFETMRELKKRYPMIKCLVLSSITSDQAMLMMLKNGACGYVMKDIAAEEFKNAITGVMTDGFFFDAAIKERFPDIGMAKMSEYVKEAFSDQEVQFLKFCCSSMNYEQIGAQMNLSGRTVEHYSEKVREKTGFHHRYELAMFSLAAGIGRFDEGIAGGGVVGEV
jgi:two-component system, NarL family, invasion response regulator UvrY